MINIGCTGTEEDALERQHHSIVIFNCFQQIWKFTKKKKKKWIALILKSSGIFKL